MEKVRNPLWNNSIIRKFNEGRNLPTLILRTLFPFFSAAILGAVASDFLVKNDNDISNLLDKPVLLIVISLVFILSSIFAGILKLIYVEERINTFKINISRDYSSSKRNTAFDFCKAVVRKAQKSIYVVGPHFTTTLTNPGSGSHTDYLTDGIEALFQRHKVSEHDFQYFRIIQLDAGKKNDCINEYGEIEFGAIQNEALSNHVTNVLTENNLSEFLQCDVWARDFVPSLPSILVVDDHYVFFSLPTYLSKNDRNTNNGSNQLNYDFVVEIEDKTGEIPDQFKRMIRQFSIDAVHVKSVAKPKNPIISIDEDSETQSG